jgi:hypothetical protein
MKQQSSIDDNRYARHAAATVQQFRDLWYAKGPPELGKPLTGCVRNPPSSIL